MTEAPVAEVEVTRDHRERAYRCIWLDEPRGNERRWLETGDASNLPLRLAATAQAIAAAEARGRAESAAEVTCLKGDVEMLRAKVLLLESEALGLKG